MALSSEAQEEALETKLAQVHHFDGASDSFARSLLADCSDIEKRIDDAHHPGPSEDSVLSTAQDEAAEAASKIADVRKKHKTQCGKRTSNEDASLAYVAAQLGIEGELPTASGQAAHAKEKKVEPLGVSLARFRSAGDALEAWFEEMENFVRAHESGAQAADGVFDGILNYYLHIYNTLAENDGNPNDSTLSSGSSFLDDSQLGLHAYNDLLGTQQATQMRSVQQRQQELARLTKDVEAVKGATIDLKLENLELNAQIKANHMEAKNTACRILKSKKSRIRGVVGLVRPASAKARTSLVRAEPATSDGLGNTWPGHVDCDSELRHEILKEHFEFLQDALARRHSDEELKRQQMRMNEALRCLQTTSRCIREDNPIDASKDTLRAYEQLMKQDKAILLLDGTVDGRKFADWLPDIMALARTS